MSYCQPGNLQNIEMGLRRCKQNCRSEVSTREASRDTQGFTLQHYTDSYTFKSLSPQNELHCLDRTCVYTGKCSLQWKTTWNEKQKWLEHCNFLIDFFYTSRPVPCSSAQSWWEFIASVGRVYYLLLII